MSTSLSSSLRAICPLLPPPPPCSCCIRFLCLGDRFSKLSSDWKSSSVEDSLTWVLFSSFETMTTSSVPLFLGVRTRDRRCDEPKDLVEEADEEEPELVAMVSELSMMTGGWLVTTVTWLTLVARLLEGSARTVSLLMVMVVVLAFGVEVIRISSSGGNIGGGGWYSCCCWAG